jgi:hypothetical protein
MMKIAFFMDKRSGRWWRQDPSGVLEEALRPSPEERRAVWRSFSGFLAFWLVVWGIVLAIGAVLFLSGYSF